MSIAVIYWSSTGNTEAMAQAVEEGAKSAGAETILLPSAAFDASMVSQYDAIAFGCPAMGSEVLEESEFEPMFTACLPELSGKTIALFGSYGWGGRRVDASVGGQLHQCRGQAGLRQCDLLRLS